jgi:hypothetical protein
MFSLFEEPQPLPPGEVARNERVRGHRVALRQRSAPSLGRYRVRPLPEGEVEEEAND